jgi:2-polyprenyl-3-methyl-5-hydroxy-6-metoxy-1,4-benzoquinol methylase
MNRIFDTYIDNAFDGHHQAEFKFYQFALNYKKFFPSDKRAYLLDIGVGRGEMLSCMRELGYTNYGGIDISPSTVRFCQSIGLNCKEVDDAVNFLQKHKDTYSLITLLDVLEHIKKENVVDFLSAIGQALKPGGIIIIQVPNMQAPDSQLHRYNDITHEVGYIEHSLQQVLLVAGFERIIFYGFETFCSNDIKTNIIKILRYLYWKLIRFNRSINGNLNPKILHPVLFSVAMNNLK